MSNARIAVKAGIARTRDTLGDALAPVGQFTAKKSVRVPLIVLGTLFLFALPILEPPFISTPGSDFGGVLYTVGAYALVAIGLNIVIGYAGLLDLGYVGFYAVGAYTIGTFTSLHGDWPFFAVIPIAIAATMVAGVILGAPTLRVRGDYLAIVTLGFGEIIRLIALNTPFLGQSRGITQIPRPPGIGGPDGLFQIPHLDWSQGYPLLNLDDTTKFLYFGVLDFTPYYWLVLVAVIVVLFIDRLIYRSRVGRAWVATRDDEDVAEIMGIPTFKFKLLAFALGAAIGGLAGAFFAARQGSIEPRAFPLTLSTLFVAAVVIGGAGNRWGAIAGAALVAYLPERFRELQDFRILLFGVALIAIVSFRPQGLFPGRSATRSRRAQRENQRLESGDLDPVDPGGGHA